MQTVCPPLSALVSLFALGCTGQIGATQQSALGHCAEVNLRELHNASGPLVMTPHEEGETIRFDDGALLVPARGRGTGVRSAHPLTALALRYRSAGEGRRALMFYFREPLDSPRWWNPIEDLWTTESPRTERVEFSSARSEFRIDAQPGDDFASYLAIEALEICSNEPWLNSPPDATADAANDAGIEASPDGGTGDRDSGSSDPGVTIRTSCEDGQSVVDIEVSSDSRFTVRDNRGSPPLEVSRGEHRYGTYPNGSHVEIEVTGSELRTTEEFFAECYRCTAPSYRSALPGEAGFGLSTRHAYGGSVEPELYVVDNLNDSGPGSLREAFEAAEPRVVIFAVGGLVNLRRKVSIRHPYIWVAGQTAPSPGIHIPQGLDLRTHDALIQHVTFRQTGNHGASGDGNYGDAAQLGNNQCLIPSASPYPWHHIVFDHCTFSWGVDETFSVGEMSDISFQHSIVSEAVGAGGTHQFGFMSWGWNSRMDLIGNYFYRNDQRQPMSRSREFYMANNVLYNRGLRWVQLSDGDSNGLPLSCCCGARACGNEDNACGGNADGRLPYPAEPTSQTTVEYNLFREGPARQFSEPLYYLRQSYPSTQRYFGPSFWQRGDDWELFANEEGVVRSDASNRGRFVRSPPITVEGYCPLRERVEIEQSVLDEVGPRPWDRSAIDRDHIARYRTGTAHGAIANSLEDTDHDSARWLRMPSTIRAITSELPADPHSLHPNGRTRLENWLLDPLNYGR